MPRREWVHRTEVRKDENGWWWGCYRPGCLTHSVPDQPTGFRLAECHAFVGGYTHCPD